VFGIHSATHPRYPDGVAAADRVTPERRRSAIGLPRPLWIGVAGVLDVEFTGHRADGQPM